uniref:Uncharacterized protein n=1 Tax=Magallana gigas TaxID=29159 RepID=K1PXN4_MAGGI
MAESSEKSLSKSHSDPLVKSGSYFTPKVPLGEGVQWPSTKFLGQDLISMGHRVTGYNPEYIQKHTNCSWVRERPWADLSNIHPGVNPVDSTWIKIPQGETLMKFYVHTEEPPFTVVVKWGDSDDQDLNKIIKIFMSNFEKRRKSLNLSGNVLQAIKNMDDIYVKWKSISTDNNAQITGNHSAKELDTSDLVKSENQDDSLEKNHSSKKKTPPYSVQEFLELATALSTKQQRQHAIVLYKDILKKEPTNQTALIGIADCYMNAGRSSDALPYLQQAQSTNDLAFRLGQCYVKMGEYDKAIETLIGYCKELRTRGGTSAAHKQDLQVWLAKAYIGKKQTDMALVVLQGVLRENQEHLDALTEYAPLIYRLGPKQKDEAMTILLTVLVNKLNDNHVKEKFAYLCQQEHGMQVLESMSGPAWRDVPAVVFMATSLRDAGAIEQTEALLKHACMLQPENPHTLLTYVHTLELVEKHTEAVQEIMAYIKQWPEKEIGSFKIGSLLPILNNFHGDVYLNVPDGNIPCSSVSMETLSGPYLEDTNYLLAILFTLVKILFVKGAVAFIRPITNIIDPLTKGHELHKTNIRNEAAYFSCISQLQGITPEVNHVVPSQQNVYFVGDSHCVPPAWQTIRIKGEDRIVHPILSTGTKIWHLREESTFYPKYNFNSAITKIPDGAMTIFCFGEIDCREALLLSLVMQFNQRLKDRLMSQDSLKWLNFVDNLLTKECGDLKLKKQFDPLTKGHELHKTNIRNEAAYFSCISQLQGITPEVNHVVPSQQNVYFVGDSHCVPPAWQAIRIKGEDRIVHPILSTGTKIWHLREESTFYPKYNFNSAITKIPDGAMTIFCFGEIDCREALLLCSLEEGIDRVIDIYVTLLTRLQNLHHWDVYVHPVLPVLDLTRSLVMQFNQRLKDRLMSQDSLKWLNFVDNLLTKESGELKLKKQFEFVILQSALQLVDKVQQNGQNISSNEDRANSSVNVLKLAVQEIVQGVEEDNEPGEQLAWSKRIHCTVLYKVLTLHYGESLEKLSVEIIDDFSDGPIEPQKIDSRDALSSILPPVSLSLYFNIVQQCDWFHFFTEALSCSLLGSLTSEAEQRFISVCETTILMHPDNLNSKPTPTPSKVSVMVDSKNLCRQVIESLSEACKNCDVRDTCETIHNYLSSLLKSVTFNNDIFPDICITAAIWRIQERQTAFKDILLRFVKSPVASLWSCDKLLSVLQSQPEILAEEEIMLHLYDLVWKLNGTLAKPHLNKLIKLVFDSFGHLDFSSCGKHVLHVYRTYKQWPNPNPIAPQSLNQTLNKITAGIAGKVLLEVLQAALQDADLIMVQLLERAAGSTQQADIVCSIFQTLRELCVCPDDSGRSKLCSKMDWFLTTHSFNQKEQDIVIKFLQSLIKSSPEADHVLNAEEFYLSVIVPHLSLHRPNHSVLSVRLALDLGTMLLGEILNQGKSNLDLTLSLVLAAEVLDNCSVLWCDDTEKVTVKQRLVAFLNQLSQFQKLETTFCVNWIVNVTMDYDCAVRMAILQVCLTEEEFHDVCDILCRDLFLADKDLDYVNILRLAAVSETLSDRIGSYCQQKLNYNILILTLLQVGPHLITEEWIRMFKFLRNLISLRHLNVSLLSDFLKLQRYMYSEDQRSPAATEYCIRSAMAVFKNVVMEDITSIPSQCCLFLLTQSFSHIIMATGENPTEMLDSVNILLLDIVCQIEELSKGNSGTAFRDQMSGILHTSHSIRNAETKEMVQKKIFSFLQ